MLTSHRVICAFVPGMMVLGAGVVSGQTTSTGSGQATSTVSGQVYPNKPIRIVATGVGSASDLAARFIAPALTDNVGQPVVVDNRTGGLVMAEIVAKAPPDGYTVLLSGSSLWLWPLMQDKASYDPVKDYSPITLVTTSPLIVVVHPAVPVKSIKELIALAKARPGALNYAAGAVGAASHLGPELFKAMAGVNIVHVPYKGSGAAIVDLIGGQVQVSFTSAGSVAQHVKSGKLRGLAITSAQPSELVPGLPTVAASGLPGYEAVSMTALLAPAKTPRVLIERLNNEVGRILNKADIKERFFNSGVETSANSPEQLAVAIKSEMVRLGKVIKDAGIRAE